MRSCKAAYSSFTKHWSFCRHFIETGKIDRNYWKLPCSESLVVGLSCKTNITIYCHVEIYEDSTKYCEVNSGFGLEIPKKLTQLFSDNTLHCVRGWLVNVGQKLISFFLLTKRTTYRVCFRNLFSCTLAPYETVKVKVYF